MRRLVLTLAATLAVAGPLASSDMAAAKDRHDGGRQHQRQRDDNRGGERGNGGERGGGRWRDAPDRGDYPRGEPRGYPRGGETRGEPRGDPHAYSRDPRAYAPREPDERVIQDHARYRLRAPPRGYSWVRMGNGFALIQESTGQVFDVIPGR